MKNPLPPDVVARLIQDFGSRADAVAERLLEYREDDRSPYIDGRLLRCIVYSASGEERRVQELIEMAVSDYRDVIMVCECDRDNRHLRDLRVSFLIDTPEKKWISGIACMMASRGYTLSSLETRVATVGSPMYGPGFEGSEKFVGPNEGIEIEKKDGLWSIRGDQKSLEIHNLNRAFDYESVFTDAVSGYLLMRQKPRVR